MTVDNEPLTDREKADIRSNAPAPWGLSLTRWLEERGWL